MGRKIAYWASTIIVGGSARRAELPHRERAGSRALAEGRLPAAPSHRPCVKPAAAIVLLIPGLALLKEWAYAGATSTWIMASLSGT